MSKIEKLKEKLYKQPSPKDFTWDDLKKLLLNYGFKEIQGTGSRVKFIHEKLLYPINLHRPHPENTLKKYVIESIKVALNEIKCLEKD